VPASPCQQSRREYGPWYNPGSLAGVAESVDAPDSKSGSLRGVWVRVPPPAQQEIPAKWNNICPKQGGPTLSPGLVYTNYYTNALRQCVLHSFGGFALHVGQHVGVSIEGYGDTGMTKHLGDYLGVDIPAEK
jgi:hypothetical protein